MDLWLPAYVGFGVMAAEFAARAMGYEPLGRRYVNSYFWIGDPVLGFRNRANGRFRNRSIVGNPLITTDLNGFRNGFRWDPEYDGPLVLLVGDSTVFCAEVDDNLTLASEIAKEIMPDFPAVRVLNAGVRGYGTLQSKRMLGLLLAQYPNVRLAIYVGIGNDIVENMNPITYYPARAPYAVWDAVQRKVMEVEVERPLCLKQSVYAKPHTMGTAVRALPASFNFVGERFALLSLLPGAVHHRLLSINLHKLPEGMFGPLHTQLDWIRLRDWAFERGAIQVFDGLLREMKAMCNSKAVEFLATAYATSKVDSEMLYNRFLRLKIPHVDIRTYFTDEFCSYCSRRKTGRLDPHYGPKGTRTFAKAIGGPIKEILSKLKC